LLDDPAEYLRVRRRVADRLTCFSLWFLQPRHRRQELLVATRPLAVIVEPTHGAAEVPEARLCIVVVLLVHTHVCGHVGEFLHRERTVTLALEIADVVFLLPRQIEFAGCYQLAHEHVERALGHTHPVVTLTGIHADVFLEDDLAVAYHQNALTVDP